MKMRLRTFSYLLAALLSVTLVAVAGLGVMYFILAPKLPSVEALRDVQFQVPLKVFTRDGALIAEFGEKRRDPVRYDEVPERLVQAFIAAEDDRFFEHPGVDYQGLLRAIWYLVRTGEKGPGGSTITMQVARNFFLSPEKTYLRKANEILLALKIDRDLSKQEIMELYLNKIYLGNRAYGVGSAAQIYYGRSVQELTLAQIAMIAGLPKAPSSYNPIVNPERALTRRAYVLGRMRGLGYIEEAAYQEAMAAPITARSFSQTVEVEAPYVAEMVRAEMVARFGADQAYTGGYRVYTTLDSKQQLAANAALRRALIDYDERHGYRGPLARLDMATLASPEQRKAALQRYYPIGDSRAALVTAVREDGASVLVAGADEEQTLPWPGMQWARKFISRETVGDPPKKTSDVVAVGDVIRVRPAPEGLRLTAIPEVDGALVALAPENGRLIALVGGFDFFQSKFNRATQALRQPGSVFKPFVYSAALERGFTLATVVNDAPVVFEDEALESTWRPENYSGRFYGPTRLREGLTHSRNLVSIRVLQSIGVPFARGYIGRFGFAPDRLPNNLSLSLGNASVTPMELTAGYAVIANGGFRVQPYFIERIQDSGGNILFEAKPAVACYGCPAEVAAKPIVTAGTGDSLAAAEPAPARAEQVITSQNAYLMNQMMRDVIRYGTGRRILQLGRSDLAGKTGTTNEQRDAWFAGFNRSVVAAAWVGFDDVAPLGAGETGSRVALPMWLDFMREALRDMPENSLPEPEGMVTVRIDPETGLAASANNPDAIFEVFRADTVPEPEAAGRGSSGDGGRSPRGPDESIF